MTLLAIRCFFLVITSIVGYYVGHIMGVPIRGIQIGIVGGALIIFAESRFKKMSLRGLSSLVFGLLLGIFMAKLLSDIISLLPLGDFVQSVTRVSLTLVFSYFGGVMALRGKDEFNIIVPYVRFTRQDVKEGVILIDTSAIIDGRMMDIHKSNFMAGRLVIPKFILAELQQLADSSDDIKRQKGRRGMELLHIMQTDTNMDIRIQEAELQDGEEVDHALMRLARFMEARICTTDYNLDRIATIQGLSILNVHTLSSALKSVVFSGEDLDVKLVKEGKEDNQAIAYLNDGTMVVVGQAKDLIGEQVNVTVTSILQTQAGKIVFAKLN